MPSTPSRSTPSSPEPIYSHATRRDAGSHHRSNRSSSDRLSKRIASMLLYDERETNDLRRMLLSVTEELKQESQRADDNERRAREAIQRFRAINEARVAAQQDAARANEELRLYKLQLEYAQKEILKAQDILDSLEAQRHDAETSAANARNVARKLREESIVDLAREEGRRFGLQEALARARRLGSEQARSTSDRRDSRPVPNNPSHPDDQDEVGSFLRAGTPTAVEPPLDPIGETMLSFPPSPPAVRSSNPQVLSHPEPVLPPLSDIQPIVVRNTPSPSPHPESIIPPDGFIPHAASDSTIRLPPPHEMVRAVSPTSPTLNRQASMESEPLMVRIAEVRRDVYPLEPESPGSTTISQFELVSEPNGSISRPSRKKRRSLSVIPESVSGDNTPAGGSRSISMDRGSPQVSPASVSHAVTQSPVPTSTSPTFVRARVGDGSHDPNHYVYHRPSYASTSSSSVHQTPVRSTRSLGRMSSLSSVLEIPIEVVPPSRSQTQTPQATPYAPPGGGFLSAEDAAYRPISPTISSSVLDPSTSPVVRQDSSAGPTGGPAPSVIPLTDGQLPAGFVPMNVPSPSQPPPSRRTPGSPYSTPVVPIPKNAAVMSPRLSAQTEPHPLYSVPVPDASSSSGRLSSHNPVRIPVTSTTADSSVMVPPASLFSQPNEPSSSETDEDDAVASSLASSNDTFTTPPPSRKKHAKKSRRPTYDAAPTTPGVAYPSSPLLHANTLAATGQPGTSAGQMRGGSAGMTPGSRHKNLRH